MANFLEANLALFKFKCTGWNIYDLRQLCVNRSSKIHHDSRVFMYDCLLVEHELFQRKRLLVLLFLFLHLVCYYLFLDVQSVHRYWQCSFKGLVEREIKSALECCRLSRLILDKVRWKKDTYESDMFWFFWSLLINMATDCDIILQQLQLFLLIFELLRLLLNQSL